MKKNLLISFLLCCSIFKSADAQLPSMLPGQPVNLQSPNAATLGLFGNIPVSYYTGVPDISVPLYKLKSRSITLPVSLSYHASGFRPDMHPGWVGMGWNLSAGGAISRNVKDIPDEYSNASYGSDFTNSGFYYNHNVLNTANWNQTTYMKSIAEGLSSSTKDTEPDEFSFNFNGYSGSFYLDADGSCKVSCNKPIVVSFSSTFLSMPFQAPYGSSADTHGYSKSFGGFTITTEDGTQYIFGNSTDAIEYSIPFFYQNSNEWTASTWYLTKILAPDGDQMTFTYQRDNYINQMYISWFEDLGTKVKSSGGIFNPSPSCSSQSSYNSEYYCYDGRLVAPVYLSQITTADANLKFNRSTSTELRYDQVVYAAKWSGFTQTSTGYLTFLPFLDTYRNSEDYPHNLTNLQWKKLDQLRIEKTDGTLLKAFDFGYNNNAAERLTLLSVTESGQSGQSNPPYTFSYDQSQPLPGYLASKTDHWGFYNGTYANMSNTTNNYLTYYNYREPNANYLYAGTLNKITYPTGGVTEFIYEPNYYQKQVQLDRSLPPVSLSSQALAGGLRIKKVSSYDPAKPAIPPVTKEYSYLNNYFNSPTGSGVLGGIIKYYFSDYKANTFNNSGTTYSKSIFTSQSVLPGCTNIPGSHIGYTTVEEKRQDGSLTIFGFSNYDTGSTDEHADNSLQPERSEYEPYTSNDEARGKMLSQDVYDASGNITYSKHNQYVALNKASSFVKSLRADFFNVCAGTSVAVEEGTATKLYYYSYLPSQEIVTDYRYNYPFMTTQTDYAYNLTTRQLQTKTVTTSKNEALVTTYHYPYDMTAANDPNNVYPGMVSANIISPVIEEITSRTGNQVSLDRTTYYSPIPGLYRPQFSQSQKGNNDPLEYRNHYLCDVAGNLAVINADQGPATCYLWGYNHTYPVAKVTGSSYETISSFINNLTIQNSSTTDAAMRTELNKIRTGLANTNAQVITYTYSPLIGMTSMTDAKGMTLTYEYDNFQRLMNIRDSDGKIVKHYEYHYQNQ